MVRRVALSALAVKQDVRVEYWDKDGKKIVKEVRVKGAAVK